MSVTTPAGVVDTYTYNGLGLRVGKTDSTGTYSYVCDGTTPGSPVLSDGHAIYTGGTSENRGGVISFRHDDNLGSVRFTTNPSQAVTANLLGDAFGEPVSVAGSLPTPLRFAGGSGCSTDADTGIVLMGHRYYDSRIGRFLSQDPVGDGDNWYAYCDNNPVDSTDPSGLVEQLIGTLNVPGNWSRDDISNFLSNNYQNGTYVVNQGTAGQYFVTIGTSFSDAFMQGGLGLNTGSPGQGGAMFAQPGRAPGKPPLSAYKAALGKVHQIVGKQPGSARGKANNGAPMRGNTKKGYRLDPGHVDTDEIKYPDNEKGDHINYWDYSKGNYNRGAGPGVKSAEPISGGGGMSGGSPVRMTPDGPVIMEDPAQEPDAN